MIDALSRAGVPLWVAYYRRALPRFLLVRDLLAANAIGPVTSVHVDGHRTAGGRRALATGGSIPAIAGAGLLFDLGSHCVDLLDFLLGPIASVAGLRGQHRRRLRGRGRDCRRVPASAIGSSGTGDLELQRRVRRRHHDVARRRRALWRRRSSATATSSSREATRAAGPSCPLPAARPSAAHSDHRRRARRPGRCPSTGESGARASWVLDRCLAGNGPRG